MILQAPGSSRFLTAAQYRRLLDSQHSVLVEVLTVYRDAPVARYAEHLRGGSVLTLLASAQPAAASGDLFWAIRQARAERWTEESDDDG